MGQETDLCPNEAYLGSSESLLTRTADAIVVLADGKLPVHRAYLCHGVLAEAIVLALDEQTAGGLLRIPVPGCSIESVVPFLRLLYSQKAAETAKSMTVEQLQTAGLTADRLGFKDTLGVVEQGLLSVCRVKTPSWKVTAAGFEKCMSEKIAFGLLEWAEAVGSCHVAELCGAYLGLRDPIQTESARSSAMQAAMEAYLAMYRGTEHYLCF